MVSESGLGSGRSAIMGGRRSAKQCGESRPPNAQGLMFAQSGSLLRVHCSDGPERTLKEVANSCPRRAL